MSPTGRRSLRVAVIGAGGLGGYVGAVLHRAGAEVCLVARGETLAALRREGLHVTDERGATFEAVEAVGRVSEVGRVDVALVTVKTYDLEAVLDEVAGLASAGALVVPLLNGVEAPRRLVERGVAEEQLAPGVAYLTAFASSPGRVVRQGGHARILLGSHGEGGPEHPSLTALAEALENGAVSVTITKEIDAESWRKMLVVCALTAACGITGTAIGPVRRDPDGRGLIETAILEGTAVARAMRVPLSESRIDEVRAVVRGFPEGFYPSLVHDLRRGRRTELEALNGALVRMGAERGVPTPIHGAAACAIRLAEAGRLSKDPT